MNNLNEYATIKKLYLKLIIASTIMGPLLFMLLNYFAFVPLALIVLVINVRIYSKYYKKNETTEYQTHIRKILKKSVIASIITIVFLLPLFIYMLINVDLILVVSTITSTIGMIISYIYYVYSMIHSYLYVNKKDFDKMTENKTEMII